MEEANRPGDASERFGFYTGLARPRRIWDWAMPVKITYQNPRRPEETGVKIVQDDKQAEAEKERLEAEGFVVIEMTKLRRGWTDLA